MPSSWNRGPEEFHKIYLENTDTFYRSAGRSYKSEIDAFITDCALRVWSHSTGTTQEKVDLANQIYSRSQEKPNWLLWNMTEKMVQTGEFLPPLFFWSLVEEDARTGSQNSRILVRITTNILLYAAACDYEITDAEAQAITEITDKLNALCDSHNVKKDTGGLNPFDYVTSSAPGFLENADSSQGTQAAPKPETKAEEKTEEGTAAAEEEKPLPSQEELLEQLDSLIGLEEVKKDVKSLINLIKVRKLRTDNDLPIPPMSMHMVFMGNPGTGKTTVARLMGQLYAAIGALSKGQLIETDRSGLVAGYVGQTAMKTQEMINSALGGVLFIDEAYSLSSGGENDYGREAIETLLKAMEDHRDELVVIVAGYDEPMEKFLHSNPGLESRFNKYFYFPDYTGEELMGIFNLQCKKNGYTLSPEAEELAKQAFNVMYETRDDNFGNGRDVRNCFEDMVARQSDRVAAMEDPSKDDLMTFLPEDLVAAGLIRAEELLPDTSEEEDEEEKKKGLGRLFS